MVFGSTQFNRDIRGALVDTFVAGMCYLRKSNHQIVFDFKKARQNMWLETETLSQNSMEMIDNLSVDERLGGE